MGVHCSNFVFFLPFEEKTKYCVKVWYIVRNPSEEPIEDLEIIETINSDLVGDDYIQRIPKPISAARGLNFVSENEGTGTTSTRKFVPLIPPGTPFQLIDSIFAGTVT